jgi:hypothetical protein
MTGMQPADESLLVQREQALECRDAHAVNVKDVPVFPNQCPNCGQGADIPLPAEKVFRRGNSTYDRVLIRFDVPFCRACAAAHEHEAQPRRRHLLRRMLSRGGSGLYMLAAGIGVSLLVYFDPFGKAASYPLWQRILIPASVLLMAAFLLAIAAWETRYMTCLPPTSVTSAVDFTTKLSWGFEPAWRQFRFRRLEYARSFAEVNQDRLWRPQGDEAQRAERKGRVFRRIERIAWLAAIAGFLVWILLQRAVR